MQWESMGVPVAAGRQQVPIAPAKISHPASATTTSVNTLSSGKGRRMTRTSEAFVKANWPGWTPPMIEGTSCQCLRKSRKRIFKPWETHPARWATKTSKKTGRTSSGRRGMDLADSQRGEQSSWDYQQTDRVYGNVDHHREDSTRRSPQIDPVGRWKASPSERRSIGGTRDGSSCM
jgi:hypothetical protein